MLKKFYWFLLLVLVGACSPKAQPLVQEPEDLIPREKMVKIMTDIHLLDAGISVHNNKAVTSNTVPAPLPYFDLYKKHGVTADQYDRSFKYYSLDLTQLQSIYDDVLNELNKLQAEEARKK